MGFSPADVPSSVFFSLGAMAVFPALPAPALGSPVIYLPIGPSAWLMRSVIQAPCQMFNFTVCAWCHSSWSMNLIEICPISVMTWHMGRRFIQQSAEPLSSSQPPLIKPVTRALSCGPNFRERLQPSNPEDRQIYIFRLLSQGRPTSCCKTMRSVFATLVKCHISPLSFVILAIS